MDSNQFLENDYVFAGFKNSVFKDMQSNSTTRCNFGIPMSRLCE